MRAGSWPWLVRHDLRLGWRDFAAEWNPRVVAAILVGLLLLVHLILWRVLGPLRGAVTFENAFIPFLGLALLVVFSMMLAAAINRSVEVLFSRGDLDLLVSSPLPSKVIFTSRALSIVLTILLPVGLLVVPVVSAAVILGLPQFVGLYPASVALVAIATSLGVMLTLLLVRLFGARLARTIGQILGGLSGALFVFIFYLPSLSNRLPNPERWLGLMAPGGRLGPENPLWWPVRAVLLEPLPLLALLAFAGGLFWLTVTLAHRSFVSGTRESVTAGRSARLPQDGRLRFKGGLLTVALLKEWRLILRDPYLISQTLMQLLYLLPLAIVIFLGDRQELAGMPLLSLGLGAGAVFLGATLVSSLARICISGEEAPDLLAAAPLPRGRLRTYKLVAALLPIWLLCLPIFALLGLQSAAGWPLLLLCFVGATVSVGVLNIWNAKTVPRGELFKREAQAGRDSVLAIIEGLLIWAWLGASLGLYSGAWWGWLALGVGLLGPVIGYARYRGRGSMLMY